MAEHEAPPKMDVARALLLRGSLFVYLDPRRTEVRVPPWFAGQPQLVLQVGLDMPIPIPDLRVDDVGVFGTLSFNRAPFTVAVPWSAVFALMGDDGKGWVWAEDMPTEVAEEVDDVARRESRKDAAKAARPRLRAIEGGATESTESTESSELSAPEGDGGGTSGGTSGSDDGVPKRPTHLRRIK